MKKQIWLAAGIAGMLLGSPAANAEVNVRIGGGDRPPSFVLHSRPNFINIPNLGFSVSVGGTQDVISFGSRKIAPCVFCVQDVTSFGEGQLYVPDGHIVADSLGEIEAGK